MNTSELRSLDIKALQAKLTECCADQFKLTMQHGSGQLKNTQRLKEMRKNIARIKTLLNEKQRGKS